MEHFLHEFHGEDDFEPLNVAKVKAVVSGNQQSLKTLSFVFSTIKDHDSHRKILKKMIKGLTPSAPRLEKVIIYEAHDDTVNDYTMDLLSKICE